MRRDAAEPWAWIARAEQDRSAAKRLFTPGCIECSVIASLCQQAAEKMLKAFLVHRGVEPERTHDLRLLLALCGGLDPRFLAMADVVEPLNQYAIAARYPGPPEPSASEIVSAMEAVEMVWDLVLAIVPSPDEE